MFPEGTRTKDGNIQPFKKGGFVLAIKGGIPIAPMVLTGAMEIMQKKDLHLHKGTIQIEFLDPVPAENYKYEQRQQLIQDIRESIVSRYEASLKKD